MWAYVTDFSVDEAKEENETNRIRSGASMLSRRQWARSKENDLNKTWLFLLLFIMLLVVASVVGLALFLSSQSSDQALPQPPLAENTPVPGKTSLPVPAGACQTRLQGKITNSATGQATANVIVNIQSGSSKAETKTDNNGLYGFAGLCAGKYTLTITPPGGKPIASPNPVSLDGSNTTSKVDLPFK
jgi:flagellar basal body-associated protein FliL